MKKRRARAEPDNPERWMVSYADFLTLLFAFFTVMYATSQSDLEKQTSFEKSVRKAFGMFQTPSGGTDHGILSEPVPTYSKDGSPIESQIKIFQNSSIPNSEKRDALWQILDKKLTPEQIKNGGIQLRDEKEGVRVTLNAKNLFASGSAKILPEATTSLAILGSIFKLIQHPLVVEGYSDDDHVQSDIYPSNWELAAARAATIVRYLIKVHKVPADLLTVVSYGDQRPVAPNDSPENRAKNRRIEILISTN